jgi:hypothetical protein
MCRISLPCFEGHAEEFLLRCCRVNFQYSFSVVVRFLDCFRKKTWQRKPMDVRFGDLDGHNPFETILSANSFFSMPVAFLTVWYVQPSCWIYQYLSWSSSIIIQSHKVQCFLLRYGFKCITRYITLRSPDRMWHLLTSRHIRVHYKWLWLFAEIKATRWPIQKAVDYVRDELKRNPL